MITTGIIRRIDDLGRIVIPRDLRIKALGKAETEGWPFELYYEKDGTIILKPYRVVTAKDKLDSIKEKLEEHEPVTGLSYTQMTALLTEIEKIVNQ